MAVKNGWEEGSAEKNALHALVGGIMSELTGSGFLAGASGAMVNEMIQDKLSDMFKDDPAMHQWASALIGGVVSEIVTGNAQAGASTAASGTKNNYLNHKQEAERLAAIAEIKNSDMTEEEKQEAIDKVNEYYIELSREQTAKGESGEETGMGYEFGYDPEIGGAMNVLPNDLNAQNSLQQYVTLMEVCNNIDSSQWKENELRSYLLGSGVNLGEIVSINGATGFAKDQKGNVYKVYVATVDAGITLENLNIKMSDVFKALNKFTINSTTQALSGTYNAETLREEYTKDSFAFSATHAGINISASRTFDDFNKNGTASIGGSSNITNVNLGYIHLEYVGNINER